MRSKPLIYIGDLTYDTNMIAVEHIPIGIGYVVSYAEAKLPGQFKIEIFKMPNKILDAIDGNPPDILALGYFPWNRNLDQLVVDQFLRQNPDGLVVFGGTTFSFVKSQQRDFFTRMHPAVDVFVTNDGEFGFVELLKNFAACNGKKDAILAGPPINGCVFLDRNNDQLRVGNHIPRLKSLDDIPSPYLSGLMDRFLANHLFVPLVQATRGCPFRCTYCWAGNENNSRIGEFSIERVTAELEYIALRRKDLPHKMLMLADSNFGMRKRDLLIADKMIDLQKKHSYPTTYSLIYGQTNQEQVFETVKGFKDIVGQVSFQSTNSKILKNVKRPPVAINKQKDNIAKFKNAGIPVATEIITGLPGETRSTHLQTLKDIISMELDSVTAFSLMLIEGSEIANPESIRKNKWDTRYRVIPRNFGKYRDKISIEIETVAIGSATYNFDDYMYFRGLHLVMRAVFFHTVFQHFIYYLRQRKVDLFDFCIAFYANLKEFQGRVGDEFRSFMHEAREEIWDSMEELKAYFQKPENYRKLINGEMGDNLLGKYRAIMLTESFDKWCDFYFEQALQAVAGTINEDNSRAELNDIKNHTLGKAFHIISPENMRGEAVFKALNHNVLQWEKDGFVKPLGDYKFDKPGRIKYVIPENKRQLVQEILEVSKRERSEFWKVVGYRYHIPAIFRLSNP